MRRSKRDIAKLEKVQKRPTKLLSGIKGLPHPERLINLYLPSLEHRRKRGHFIGVHKYLHGLYNVQSLSLEQNSKVITSGNVMKLAKTRL